MAESQCPFCDLAELRPVAEQDAVFAIGDRIR